MQDFTHRGKGSRLFILAVLVVLLLIIGISLGLFWGSGKKAEMISSFSSKVISSMTAYGNIEKISGRIITLNNLDDSLNITVADNAQVYSFSAPVTDPKTKITKAPAQQSVKFESLKVGDKVNLAIELLPSGDLQATSIVIISQ